MKIGGDFFKIWGGISGIQHTLPLLITEAKNRHKIALPLLARLTSLNVAQRFNLQCSKGRIAIDADADLALIDLKQSFEIKSEDLLYRHPHSPYVGRALTGRVVQTISRGRTVFKDGRIVSKPFGRLVKASAKSAG